MIATAESVSGPSFACRAAIPSLGGRSSRALGWTSLLVDLHEGMAWDQPYEAVATLDPRVGISLKGRYVSAFEQRGAWRHDCFRTGTTTLLRSEERRRFRFSPLDTRDCSFALVYFPLGLLEAAADHLARAGQKPPAPWFNQLLGEDPAILHVARALIVAMATGADELYAEAVATWLAIHVLTAARLGTQLEADRSPGDIPDRRFRRVIELMTAHFDSKLTIDRLSGEAGISKFHFVRLFREKFGTTPSRYLGEIRLSAARSLLSGSDMTLADIAPACGYAAVPQFSAAFRARFGVSPGAFRRACRGERDPLSARRKIAGSPVEGW